MRAAAAADLSRWFSPLDRARSLMFVWAKRLGLSSVLAERDRRLAFLGVVHVFVAFPLALLAAPLLLIVGPLVLRVPHLVGDVRHLVVRRQLPTMFRTGVYLSCGGLIGLRVVEEAGLWRTPIRIEMGLVGVVFVLAAAAGARSGRKPWLPIVVAALALVVGMVGRPRLARLAMLHGHNAVALVVWLVIFRNHRRAVIAPLMLIVVAFVLLSTGALAHVSAAYGMPTFGGMSTLRASRFLAPGVANEQLALGITTGFAFLQSVHYAVWLIYVPQDDAATGGLTSFRRSVRSLASDIGVTGILAAVVLMAAAAAFAFVDALQARALYLSLASFHGYFEVAMLLYFVGRGSDDVLVDTGAHERLAGTST